MKKVFESIMEATRVFFGGQPDAKVLSTAEFKELVTLPYDEIPSELLRFISGANTKWHIMSDWVQVYYIFGSKLHSPFFPGVEFSISAGERYLRSCCRLPLTIELRTIQDHGRTMYCAIIYPTTTS